jgi:3-isopropylmalate dehydrogenase
MTEYTISVIRGDGIGPELTDATMKVLDAAQQKFGLKLKMIEAEAGDTCFEKRGVALPEDSVQKIKDSHVCLKGPVGETAADVIVKLPLKWRDPTSTCFSSEKTPRTSTKDKNSP